MDSCSSNRGFASIGSEIAKERYACLSPWERDPALYGRAATTEGYATCEAPVVAVLRHLLARRLEYAHNAFFTSPMFRLSCLRCEIQREGPFEMSWGEPRLECAIGITNRPDTELQSHYFQAALPWQFDAYCWFDETRAVTPLKAEQAQAQLPTVYG